VASIKLGPCCPVLSSGCHLLLIQQMNLAVVLADAHRALELLEDYHSQLTNAAERPLRSAIERVIRIFKSRLFQALLGKPSFRSMIR